MRLFTGVVAVFLVSCGPPGTVAPTAATIEDLAGWWLSIDPDGAQRIYGVVPAPDGPWSVPVPFSYRDRALSANYVGSGPELRSSLEVRDGALLETVIDSASFEPGKQFSTKLVSLVRRKSLSLESKSAPGGVRAYTWNEHCPATIASGWSVAATLNNPSYFATASTMAFDSKGRLHTFTGMSGEQNGSLPARPTYSVLDKGCEAIWFTASNARSASLVVDGSDVVHLFWTESAIYSDSPDGTLMHKYRHTDSEQWTTETLSTSLEPLVFKVAARGARLVLVTQRRGGALELGEFRDGAWSTTTATFDSAVPGAPSGASLDPSGRLWLSFGGRLLRERAPATFEVLPAPPAPLELSGDFYVDGAGRAHHLVARGPDGVLHGIYENDAWRFLLAPRAEGFVPVEGPPWKFLSVTTHAFPFLVLTTQTDTGVNSSEFVTGRHYNPNVATVRGVAVGRDGTIAVSETGEYVNVKRPVAPWGVVPTVPVTITIGGTGAGRVWTEDGRIDCTATCMVDLPLFSRHRLHLDPAPMNTLSKAGGEPDDFPTKFTWLNVTADPAQSPGGGANQLAVEFARATAQEVIALAPTTGSLGSLSRWDARGASVVLSSATTAGKVYFRDAEFTAPGSGAGEVLLLSSGGGSPVLKRLPTAPAALGVLAGGGAHALFLVNRALTFDGTPVSGTAAAPIVVYVRWDAALAQVQLQPMMTLPANSLLAASAVDPSGSAAALLENGSGFAAYGASVFEVLAWRGAGGGVTLTPFEANVRLPSPRLALRGARLVASSGADFSVFDDGARSASRQLIGADVGPVVVAASGVQALSTTTSGGVDFGGGSLNPTSTSQYVVTWGFDATYVSATQQQPAFTRVVQVAPESRGVLVLDQTSGGPYLFLAGLDRGEPLVRTPSAVRATSASGDGDAMWVLVQQQAGSVDYGLTTLPGAGRLVLLKAALP